MGFLEYCLVIVLILMVPIGNAKIEGMLTDLNMSGTQYNVALGIFFVTYVLFGRPSSNCPLLVFPLTWTSRGPKQYSAGQIQETLILSRNPDPLVGNRRNPNRSRPKLCRPVRRPRAAWYLRVRLILFPILCLPCLAF